MTEPIQSHLYPLSENPSHFAELPECLVCQETHSFPNNPMIGHIAINMHPIFKVQKYRPDKPLIHPMHLRCARDSISRRPTCPSCRYPFLRNTQLLLTELADQDPTKHGLIFQRLDRSGGAVKIYGTIKVVRLRIAAAIEDVGRWITFSSKRMAVVFLVTQIPFVLLINGCASLCISPLSSILRGILALLFVPASFILWLLYNGLLTILLIMLFRGFSLRRAVLDVYDSVVSLIEFLRNFPHSLNQLHGQD
jgi:hypothetical protein